MTCPRVVVWVCRHAGPHRVQVQVDEKIVPVLLIQNELAAETPFEKCAVVSGRSIHLLAVSEKEVLHRLRQVGPGRFQHEVKVIGHQRETVDYYLVPGHDLVQEVEEERTGFIVPEYLLMADASIHHVVTRAWIINSRWSRHEPSVPVSKTIVNRTGLTPRGKIGGAYTLGGVGHGFRFFGGRKCGFPVV